MRASWLGPDQLKSLTVSTARSGLATLQRVIAEKDPETHRHSARVRQYVVALTRQLKLGRGAAREIGWAALYHDVGKIGVPSHLLSKPGALSARERRQVLRHAVIGERMLAALMLHRPVVLAVARWHHERVDGSGYPDRLRGGSIPLAARIVAVADAFDAMTSRRPYRGRLSIPAALRELRRSAGAQFDPRCVAAFCASVARWVLRVCTPGHWGRQGRAVCTSGRSPNRGSSLPCPLLGVSEESRGPPGGLVGPTGGPPLLGSET